MVRHSYYWRSPVTQFRVSRGDYEPITVPITLAQQDLSHGKPQLSYWRSPVTQFRVSRGDYEPITVPITLV